MTQQILNKTLLTGIVALADALISSEENFIAMVSLLQAEISTIMLERHGQDFAQIQSDFRSILARMESRHETAQAIIGDLRTALEAM